MHKHHYQKNTIKGKMLRKEKADKVINGCN